MTTGRRQSVAALVFFCAFFLVTASGRVASQDAGQQLQVALLLLTTGQFSAEPVRGELDTTGWVPAPDGRLYQAHDIGNALFMVPGAAAGTYLAGRVTPDAVLSPPLPSRVAVGLSCSLIAAVACWWLFRLFALVESVRAAFVLALLFPMTTIFLAYARAAWDVLGACCFMCGVLFYSVAAALDVRPRRSVLLGAAALAAACSFRYSLAPFLVPAAGVVALTLRQRVGARTLLLAAAVFMVLMLPQLAYNAVRTGSAWVPATAAPQYLHGANAMSGNLIGGLAGLLLSPNKGLVAFSPVLLFALAPLASQPTTFRRVLLLYGIGAAGYVLLIARLVNWGTFGWGPRYLVPILPIIFVPAALNLVRAYRARPRLTVMAAVTCAVLAIPPAVVNWHLVLTSMNTGTMTSLVPRAQLAGWRALTLGLKGGSLPVPSTADSAIRASTAEFPDLFLVRLARHSGHRSAIVLAGCLLLGALGWSGAVLWRSPVKPMGLHG